MKFTSEDLLKAMGLKVWDKVAYLDRKGLPIVTGKQIGRAHV